MGYMALPVALLEMAEIGSVWQWNDDHGYEFEFYKHLEAPEETASPASSLLILCDLEWNSQVGC